MKKLAIIIAVAGLIGTSAFAADLNRPVYTPPPPAPPPPGWSGIYVGLEGGYGWGTPNINAVSTGDQFSPVFTPDGVLDPSLVGGFTAPVLLGAPLFFPTVAVPSIKQNGWLFGGFFGAQKQWSNWVLGIEGDIDGANIKGSGTSNASSVSPSTASFLLIGGTTLNLTCTGPCFTLNHQVSLDSKIDALGSVRGKVGWSFAPDWLIYGTGGAAFAHVANTAISTESSVTGIASPIFPCTTIGTTCILTPTNISRNTSGGTTLFGWAAGGGIDWKLQLDAGSALVFGVEYLHYGFADQTITLTDNAGGTFAFRAKESVDAVKGRVSYLFSIH